MSLLKFLLAIGFLSRALCCCFFTCGVFGQRESLGR